MYIFNANSMVMGGGANALITSLKYAFVFYKCNGDDGFKQILQ